MKPPSGRSASTDARGADALCRYRSAPEPFLDAALSSIEQREVVDLEELIRFYQNPARGFLQNRLGVFLEGDPRLVEDREPIELDALARHELGALLLDRAVKDPSDATLQAFVEATGVLPDGTVGSLLYHDTWRDVRRIADSARPWLVGARKEPTPVSVNCNGTRVIGHLRQLYAAAQLYWQYARVKPRNELALWLRHLAWMAGVASPAAGVANDVAPMRPLQRAGRQTSRGEPCPAQPPASSSPLPTAKARRELAELVALFHLGHERPLPLFPAASKTYVEQLLKTERRSRPRESPRQSARRVRPHVRTPRSPKAAIRTSCARSTAATRSRAAGRRADRSRLQLCKPQGVRTDAAEPSQRGHRMKPLEPQTLPLTGVHLIEASAGTGKTYTITSLFLRLLIERELTLEQIVVVTFTKAATAELRARIRTRLYDALRALEVWDEHPSLDPVLMELMLRCPDTTLARRRLTLSLQQMDEASIFTIHGFCQRMLLEYAFESKLRFDVDLIADQRPLIQQIVQDFWAREVTVLAEAEVRYLQQSLTGLDDMVSLAYAAIQWPDMPLVEEPAPVDTAGALERYLLTRSQAQSLWQRSGEEVRRLLLGTTALHRGSYKPEKFERWFEDLDELFRTEGRSLHNFCDAVQRLSRTTLQEATNSGRPTPEHKFFEACEWLAQAHAQATLAFDGWLVHFKARLVAYARAEARRRKLEGGLVSFDDLLQQMSDALQGPHGELLAKSIRKKYPAALIDEFQDTDPIQYTVFSRIYGKQQSALFLIGDPKQAIYAFRGADIFAYLKAAADAGANTWTLHTNYRSDKSLVRALNTLFQRPYRPFLLEGISYVEVKPAQVRRRASRTWRADSERRLEILFVERAKLGTGQRAINRRWSDLSLPNWVAADIARLLASGASIDGKPVRAQRHRHPDADECAGARDGTCARPPAHPKCADRRHQCVRLERGRGNAALVAGHGRTHERRRIEKRPVHGCMGVSAAELAELAATKARGSTGSTVSGACTNCGKHVASFTRCRRSCASER